MIEYIIVFAVVAFMGFTFWWDHFHTCNVGHKWNDNICQKCGLIRNKVKK